MPSISACLARLNNLHVNWWNAQCQSHQLCMMPNVSTMASANPIGDGRAAKRPFMFFENTPSPRKRVESKTSFWLWAEGKRPNWWRWREKPSRKKNQRLPLKNNSSKNKVVFCLVSAQPQCIQCLALAQNSCTENSSPHGRTCSYLQLSGHIFLEGFTSVAVDGKL